MEPTRADSQKAMLSLVSWTVKAVETIVIHRCFATDLSKVKRIRRLETGEIVGAPRFAGFDLRVLVPY